MMGKHPQREPKLFYYDLCLEERIPQDHLLRKIQAVVDFDFNRDRGRPRDLRPPTPPSIRVRTGRFT